MVLHGYCKRKYEKFTARLNKLKQIVTYSGERNTISEIMLPAKQNGKVGRTDAVSKIAV